MPQHARVLWIRIQCRLKNSNFSDGISLAQDDVTLISGRDINIRSTQNSQAQSERQTTSGIGTAVISDTEHFAGWMKNRQDSNSRQVEQVKSQIGSLGGHVNIQAEGNYTQQVADVLAAKDLNITAKSVDVLADHNLSSSHQAERDVKIGTFAKISSPLIDLVNAAEGAVKSKADDRTQARQTLAAGAQAYSAYNTATSGGALANAEVGFKTANSSQDQSQSLSQSNVLNAGGNLNIQSTEGDIRLQHTRAAAADTLRLDSAKDLILESGQSAQTADGKNSSLGVSVGVGVSVGAQTGYYAYAEASGSKGKNHYLAQTHDHTTLKADNIQLASEGDTTLKGATATANRIDADVKGRLNIESVQDHIEQENKQTGAGVRVQVSFGTAWEASGNFSQSKASGSSDTVSTQSGLFAGDGGYHINADSVHLKGGAIASTAPKEQNELTANRFTFENIQNQSSYSASNVGLSGGYGENPDKEPGYTDGTSFSPSLPQYEKGGDNSTTYATLSEGRLNIGGKDTTVQELGIHSDSESAHRAVAALPDLAKITEKQQIVAKATADVASAVSTYRQNQLAKAQEALSNAETELMGATFSGNQSDIDAAQGRLNEARENVKAWETGGSKARALNAGTTLITGILGGQSEIQAAVNSASPYTAAIIGQTFGQNGSHPNEGLQLLAHAVNSGILAVVNGGSFEAGAISGAGSELAAKVLTHILFGEEAAANPNALGEQEKTLVSDLSAVFGMVSGALAGDSALNAQIGAVAGQNAVENNYLTQPQIDEFYKDLAACGVNDWACVEAVFEKNRILSRKNREDMENMCLRGNANNNSACSGIQDEAHLGLASVRGLDATDVKPTNDETDKKQSTIAPHTDKRMQEVELDVVEVEGKRPWFTQKGYSVQDFVIYENAKDLAYLDKDRKNAAKINDYLKDNTFNHTNQPKSLFRPGDLYYYLADKKPTLDYTVPDQIVLDIFKKQNEQAQNKTETETPNNLVSAAETLYELNRVRNRMIASGVDQAIINTGEAIASIPEIIENAPEIGEKIVNDVMEFVNDENSRSQTIDNTINAVKHDVNNIVYTVAQGNLSDLEDAGANVVEAVVSSVTGAKAGQMASKFAGNVIDKIELGKYTVEGDDVAKLQELTERQSRYFASGDLQPQFRETVADSHKLSAEQLPNNFTQNADNSLTGPKGGSYTPANFTDAHGNPVFKSGSRYYTVSGNKMVPIKAENITTIPSYTALTNPSGTVTAQTLAEAREKGIEKAQVPLYTTAELNHLPTDNGLVFVRESATVTGNNQRAADFQSATGGSMSVADSSRDSIVPALVYNNPDSNGNHFVKFDGYEILSDGTVQLIDSKTQLPLWSETTQRSTALNLERVANAVKQNPNFKVMYEFPDISSQRQAQKFIERNQFDEVIKTRVRGK